MTTVPSCPNCRAAASFEDAFCRLCGSKMDVQSPGAVQTHQENVDIAPVLHPANGWIIAAVVWAFVFAFVFFVPVKEERVFRPNIRPGLQGFEDRLLPGLAGGRHEVVKLTTWDLIRRKF